MSNRQTTDDIIAASRNPDGTYNGAKLLSGLTGGLISAAETSWTFRRLKALMEAGKSKDEAKAIVKAEAAGRPWERADA